MKKNLFIAAMGLLVLAGCSSNEDEIDNIIANNDNAITFDTYVGKVTKAGPTAITGDFGVFAYYKTTEQAVPANFMYNQLVKSDGTYEPAKFWPETGSVNFIAYAPLTTASKGLSINSAFDNTKATLPIVDFTLPNDASTDFIVSGEVTGTKGSPVALTLGHKLSKVYFKITDPNIDKTTITMGTIKLQGVKDKATFTFPDTWADPSGAKEMTVEVTSAESPKEYYMLPQELDDINMVIEYTITVTDEAVNGGEVITTQNAIVPLKTSTTTWEKNKQYSYSITPTLNKVEIKALVEDWTTPAQNVVIPEPQNP